MSEAIKEIVSEIESALRTKPNKVREFSKE